MTQTISSREKLNLDTEVSKDLISAGVQSDENHQSVDGTKEKALQALANKLHVVHATKGRVRIRATDGRNILLDTIIERLRQLPGITQITWNEQTQNLVIAFDGDILPQEQVLEVLTEFGVRKQELTEASKVDPFAAWKSAEFWKEQGIDLIPLFTGLAVTSRLGIAGLASIPVYMLTADVTRRLIAHFQHQLAVDKSSVETATNKAEKNQQTSQPSISKVDKSSTIEQERFTNITDITSSPSVDYSIAHAIPGRVRFHIPRIAEDKAYATRLERLLNAESHVTSVRVRSDAASIAISYQPTSLNQSHWIDLIQLADEVVPNTIVKSKSANSIEQKTIAIKEDLEVDQTSIPAMISQPSTASVSTYVNANSLICDLKPPFINLLIDVVAHFPLNTN